MTHFASLPGSGHPTVSWHRAIQLHFPSLSGSWGLVLLALVITGIFASLVYRRIARSDHGPR